MGRLWDKVKKLMNKAWDSDPVKKAVSYIPTGKSKNDPFS